MRDSIIGVVMGNIKEFKEIHSVLKVSFSKIKTEMTEHLDAINQNTTEISSLYGHLSEIETKLDKLSERIDELTLTQPHSIKEDFDIKLSVREEELFLALYIATKPLSPKEIAKELGLTEELVNQYTYKLVSKGIPIKQQTINETTFISLDKTFKHLQAKKNLIQVNDKILEQFSNLNN